MIHRADQREQEGSGGRLSGGDTSTRGGRQSTKPRGKQEVDIGRTMTMYSKAKKEKNRKFAAERMVEKAKCQQCAASKRQFARAAAKLPPGAGGGMMVIGEETNYTETL